MRILVAEDDTALGSFVKKGLEAEHYAVDVSGEGAQARAMAGEMDYDLVLLDLSLPQVDGIAILRYLRTRKPSLPILVLSGRNRVEERVQCLDLGADDYLAKPFSFTELSARIRALLRRSHVPAECVLTVEDLKLDRVERRVERAGRRLELTSKEFSLLEYLMRNAGRRVTRAMIIEHVWNLCFDTGTNVVDVYINYQNIGTTGSGDPIQVGAGAAVQALPSNFTQGSVTSTGVPTNVAIQGGGFFIVQQNGTTSYTRSGDFTVDQNNFLVTPSGQQVLGYPAVNGVVNNSGAVGPIQLGAGTISPPTATGNVQIQTNLDASATSGTVYSTPVSIYDSLGVSHNLKFTFTNTGANQWSYSLSVPAGDYTPAAGSGLPAGVITQGTLSFDGNGNLTNPGANVTGITIPNLTDGANDLTFNWNLFNGTAPNITQVAGASSTSGTTQDGATSGTLTDFSIGSDGTITGSFDNGKTSALGQLALANFANVQGLQRLGTTDYGQTLASGQAVIGVPGTGGRGKLSGGALEQSNVDIATEFANLIVAQRAFEANAKVVTTFDTITSDTIHLIPMA
jgi:flagellar hook protein FlgE